MDFSDLALGLDPDFDQPDWMIELWDTATNYYENLRYWVDENGEPQIDRIAGEFKTATHGYISAGIIAARLRLTRSYQKVCHSFTAFCEKWLGYSVWQVDRLINAAKVAIRLMGMGFSEIPANESQARMLVNLDDFDLKTAWQKVCDALPAKDRTAKAIEAILKRCHKVDPDFQGKPTAKRIELEADQYDLLEQKAARYGMTPKKYLELLLQRDLADEPLPVNPEDCSDEILEPKELDKTTETEEYYTAKPKKRPKHNKEKTTAKKAFQIVRDRLLSLTQKPNYPNPSQDNLTDENYQNFVTVQSF